MFKFHQIGNEVAKGWYCLIDTEEALAAHLTYMGHRVWENWKHIKDSPEYKDGHCRTQEAGMLKTCLMLHIEQSGKEEMSMPDCIEFLGDIMTKAVIEIFNEDGKVYVGRNGACRPTTTLLDCESILDKIKSKDYVFPVKSKRDLQVHKWTGGKHFYILDNGKSIILDGVIKWKTITAAEDALDRYWRRVKKK